MAKDINLNDLLLNGPTLPKNTGSDAETESRLLGSKPDKNDLSQEQNEDSESEINRAKLKQEALRIKAAQAITENLEKELFEKNKLRKLLVYFLMIFFIIVTIGVGTAVFMPEKMISEKVKLALITGLFGNLLGLLIVVYKYAFSNTSDSTKDIDLLMHNISLKNKQ